MSKPTPPLAVDPDLHRCMELLVEVDELVVKVFECLVETVPAPSEPAPSDNNDSISDFYFAIEQINETKLAIGRLIRNEVLHRKQSAP